MPAHSHRTAGSLAVALLGALAFAQPALSGEARPTALTPEYVEECGSCHVAFPGRMLGASSWNAVLDGLDQHFGTDASVDAATLASLRTLLASTARSKQTTQDGKPVLRITEARWFRHEHDEVPARLKSGPDAISLSSCGSCHREAERGSYSESTLRLPKKGVQK